MDVDHAFVMSANHILRENVSAADIIGHFRGQVVAHGAIDDGVLVGILLLGDLAVMSEQRQYPLIRAVLLPTHFVPQPVLAVVKRQPRVPAVRKSRDHHILHFLHGHGAIQPGALFLDRRRQLLDLHAAQSIRWHISARLRQRRFNLISVKRHFSAVSFDDFQRLLSSFSSSSI